MAITKIGDYAFMFETNLTGISIPLSVTAVEVGAFYGTGLTNLTIPSSVATLGTNAFLHCSHLSGVTIPGMSQILSLLYSKIAPP